MNEPQDYRYWITRPLNDAERDWKETGTDWIHDYWLSRDHPHRELILKALERFIPFETLLEMGCNAGPNLDRIRRRFLNVRLFGIDVNDEALKAAEHFLDDQTISLKQGNFETLPFPDKSMDVILADAVLLYVEPKHIDHVMDEITRVSKKGVVLVERFARSLGGEIVGHVWGRNYQRHLTNRGFSVESYKLKKEDWPGSVNWAKYGRLTIAKKR